MIISLLSCAILSAWVYSPHTKDIPMGIYNPTVVSERVTLFESDQECVAAYRGSDSFQDFMDDVRIQTNQHCDHGDEFLREFLLSFDEIDELVHDKIEKALKGENCKNKKLYFTGHSLGAAMALIAPIKYGIRDFEKIITFGGPRVCCWEYPMSVDKIIRVVNEKDPIPALPEPVEVSQLYHCGPHILTLPSRKVMNDYEWPPLSENYDLFDHGISHYISNLMKYINHLRSIELYQAQK